MFKKAIVVFLKEMKDLWRDKKTFIIGLIIPFMLLPTTLFIIDYSMSSSKQKASDTASIAISNTNNSFYNFCKSHENIKIKENITDVKSAMDSGLISAYITVSDTIDEDIINNKNFDVNIEYNTSSINSMMSVSIIAYYKELYSIMAKYLANNGYVSDAESLKTIISNEEINKAFMEEYPFDDENITSNINTSSLYFNMLVPMMLILYCCIGSSSTASDLSAGEKERGTLEALLSTGANRTSIIIGKLLATTTMGLISASCTVLGLSLYLIVSSGATSISLSLFEFFTLFVVTFLTAMFFASVNLAIGVYSRSSKEAQTYLMPVNIIALIPTYFTYTLDVSTIGIPHLCIPIVNIVCIIKEIFAGAVVVTDVVIVALWLITYVLIALSITSSMFKRENVLFRI